MRNIQNYISNELTHFVGRGLNEEEQFKLFIKIIEDGVLKNKEWPDNLITSQNIDWNKKISENEQYLVFMVCFCDIPVYEMNIHMEKYSKFGICFDKKFISQKGATPVHYVDINSQMPNSLFLTEFDKYVPKINSFFVDEYNRKGRKKEEAQDIIFMKFFLDKYLMSYLKFFDSSKSDIDENNYYMEREWRSLVKVKFTLDDITRIIIPSKYLSKFMEVYPKYSGHLTTV